MQIETLLNNPTTKLPVYKTNGSAGADLVADNFKLLFMAGNKNPIKEENMLEWSQLVLGPGERALIGTGIRVDIPVGYEMQIRSRSGWALKEGISVLNAPGTIDSDYRGEVGVILINNGFDAVVIEKGQAIAQAIVTSYEHVQYKVVDQLTETQRGEGGFGSTGK